MAKEGMVDESKLEVELWKRRRAEMKKKVAEDKGRDKKEKQDGLGEEQRDNR